MPYPVISGFVSGIGCIIILLQLPPRGQHVLVAGLQPGVTRILERLGTLTLILLPPCASTTAPRPWVKV